MLHYIDHTKMGSSDLGWLRSRFHFSFANYYNPDNVRFGKLRVLNDDLVLPNTGFDTHPHRDMEIISYVVDGQLTHADSMNNKRTLGRGDVQYLSAGTGITHSEHNFGDETLRFLQLWILPDKMMHQPNYGDHRFPWEERIDQWLQIVSSKDGDAVIKLNQDANIFVNYLSQGKTLDFEIKPGRQAYLVQIEGESVVNGIPLKTRDALEIIEESITIEAKQDSHQLLVELKV